MAPAHQRWLAAVVGTYLLASFGTSGQGVVRKGLTAPGPVGRAYDAIFDAGLDGLQTELASVCAPLRAGLGDDRAPVEVCRVLEALGTWWRIRLDVLDQSHDQMFVVQADAAVASTEAWVAREPNRAEAWFYLGGSYAARAQWRTARGRQLAAARDGKRIKESMERALALDPSLQDARFGVGLYQYYADVAPSALKILRWLLLLPGGDKARGLRTMEEARTRSQLLRSEATYQLHLVYLWYELAPERALALVQELRARHPGNPHFFETEAEIYDVHLSDFGASLRAWRGLFEAAAARQVAFPAVASARARLGMAVQLDRLGDTDQAVEQLRALLGGKPTSPVGIEARAHAELGRALDQLGARAEALAQYKAALAALPPGDPLKTGAVARNAMRGPPNPDTATAYRLSLEGWRAFERGDLADATRLLTRSRALRAANPTTRYRQARVWLAERRTVEAVEALELVISDPATPPHVFASACYHAARALEQQGTTTRAIELYRLVVGAFGVDPTLKGDAQRALARLAA
jgi:tetratricopeptide (TPR) repeat protein